MKQSDVLGLSDLPATASLMRRLVFLDEGDDLIGLGRGHAVASEVHGGLACRGGDVHGELGLDVVKPLVGSLSLSAKLAHLSLVLFLLGSELRSEPCLLDLFKSSFLLVFLYLAKHFVAEFFLCLDHCKSLFLNFFCVFDY